MTEPIMMPAEGVPCPNCKSTITITHYDLRETTKYKFEIVGSNRFCLKCKNQWDRSSNDSSKRA